MKYLIMVILFFNSISYCQFTIGFFTEGTNLITDKQAFHFSPINGIGIVAGYYPVDKFQIEGRLSHEMPFYLPQYYGNNFSINLNYFLMKRIYLMSIFSIHSNLGIEAEHVKMQNISLPGLGVGVKLSRLFSLEASYNIPLSKKILQTYVNTVFSPSYIPPTPSKLIGVVKLHLKVSFSF